MVRLFRDRGCFKYTVYLSRLGAGRHRQQMLRNTLSSLSQNDPQVALKVFEEADLSEQDRKAIQHVLP